MAGTWKNILLSKRKLNEFGIDAKVRFVKHHLAHCASAFYESPFEESAILSIDGTGEWTTTMFAFGKDSNIQVLREISLPNSLGVFYGAITQFLGYQARNQEGSIMGLAAYGKPVFEKEFAQLIAIDGDGIKLNTAYFKYHYDTSGKWYTSKLTNLLGSERLSNGPISEKHRNVAATLQHFTEQAVVHLAKRLYTISSSRNLCLTGGVALNTVANGKLLAETEFDQIYVCPAPHDSGTSIGAALYLARQNSTDERLSKYGSPFLGPTFTNEQIERELKKKSMDYEQVQNPEQRCAMLLKEGKVIGWFQGRMEFGPRALGNRSILADPRNPRMRDFLNNEIKHREWFRPFACSVMAERAGDFFCNIHPSPYMSFVYKVKEDKKSIVPAVTHVDGTCRVQTVAKKDNEKFYKLLREFYELTEVPLILNTSLNIAGRPIGCGIDHALSMLDHKIDYLFMNDILIKSREHQFRAPEPRSPSFR